MIFSKYSCVFSFDSWSNFSLRKFAKDLYIKMENWCTIDLWWLIYTFWANFLKQFWFSFLWRSNFSWRNFSLGLVHWKEKIMYICPLMSNIYSMCDSVLTTVNHVFDLKQLILTYFLSFENIDKRMFADD